MLNMAERAEVFLPNAAGGQPFWSNVTNKMGNEFVLEHSLRSDV
jgi:hypothetical protein